MKLAGGVRVVLFVFSSFCIKLVFVVGASWNFLANLLLSFSYKKFSSQN